MINLANYFLKKQDLYLSDLDDVQRLARCVASKYEGVDINYEDKPSATKGNVEAVVSSPDFIRLYTDRHEVLVTREEAEKLRDVLTVICAQT